MNRILHTIMILVILALGMSLSACTVHQGLGSYTQAMALDKESKAYTKQIVPVIAKNWDSALLLRLASPELREKASSDKIKTYFALLSNRLGPLKSFQDPSGQADIQETRQGKMITAVYKGQAMFAKGDGEIQIRLIKQNNQWHVLFFSVTSDALDD
jgi:hypothetical protein